MTSDRVHVPGQSPGPPAFVTKRGVVAGVLLASVSLVLGGFHDKVFAQSVSPSTSADGADSSRSAPKKTPPSAATTEDGPETKARRSTTTTEPTATTAHSSSSQGAPRKTPRSAASTEGGPGTKTETRQTTTTTEPRVTRARSSSSPSAPDDTPLSAAARTSSPATTADGSPGDVTQAAVVPARLGTAGNFAILAGTPNITNTGPTTITGDVGLHPGTAVTGFAPCPTAADCVTLIGAPHLGDAVAATAKTDLVNAYLSLVESPCTRLVDVELAGKTFLPGVYCSPGTFELSVGGTVTLDAGLNPDAEFIFLTGAGGSSLVTFGGGQVLLLGGAQACNVYWQVASSATIGVGTAFVGNILALTDIQLQTGATLEGRALARNGAVTLDTNTITRADCATVVPPDGGGGVPDGGVTPPGGGGPGGGGPGGATSPTAGDTTGGAALARTRAGLRSTDGTLSTLSPIRSARDSGLGGQAGRAAQNFAVTGAAVRWQLFLTALAIVLGGLMVLLSQPRRGAHRRRSDAGV